MKVTGVTGADLQWKLFSTSLEIRLVLEISAQQFSSQNSFLAIITEISKCDDEGDLQAVITAAQ